MSTPVIEFTDGKRPFFRLESPEVVIGRAAGCVLQIAAPGVADQHARLFTDEAGVTWLEDLGSRTGTLLNGKRVDAWEQVNEGDRIEVGAASMVFRASAPAATPQVAPEARTMIEQEAPAEVKALVARQKAAMAASMAAAKKPAPATAAAPATARPATARPAAVVEAPEPQAEAGGFRTVQMEAQDFPGLIPAPAPVAAQQRPRAGTVMGIGEMAQPAYRPPVAPASVAAPQYAPSAPAATSAPAAAGPYAAAQQEEPPAPAWTEPPQETVNNYAHPSPTPAGEQWGASPLPSPPAQSAGYPQPLQQFTPPSTAAVPEQQQWGQGQPQQQGWGAPGAGASYADQSYTPPAKKGPLGSFSRALDFYAQMFTLGMTHKALLMPLVYDLAITTALSIFLCLITLFIHSASVYYLLITVGTGALYFIDYACNSLTASLIYDQVSTGQSSMKDALPRVQKSLPGIITFAAVAGLLDMASTWARERHDVLARILLDIVRKIWSTATYVIMPAMILEGVSFGAAFKRSKDLMAQDPTGVGAGVVAMSLTSYIVGIVAFFFASLSLSVGARIHPAFGMFFFFLFVNLYWAVSGWLKISYSTLFYMWAAECEKNQSQDHALAPIPLRHALDAA